MRCVCGLLRQGSRKVYLLRADERLRSGCSAMSTLPYTTSTTCTPHRSERLGEIDQWSRMLRRAGGLSLLWLFQAPFNIDMHGELII